MKLAEIKRNKVVNIIEVDPIKLLRLTRSTSRIGRKAGLMSQKAKVTLEILMMECLSQSRRCLLLN